MISCTEFIPADNELFKYIEQKENKAAVVKFLNYLSDVSLTDLEDLAAKNGIRACWMYWGETLTEDAADFTMELDENAGEFSITMHHCPSKGSLIEYKHIEPYRDYFEQRIWKKLNGS